MTHRRLLLLAVCPTLLFACGKPAECDAVLAASAPIVRDANDPDHFTDVVTQMAALEAAAAGSESSEINWLTAEGERLRDHVAAMGGSEGMPNAHEDLVRLQQNFADAVTDVRRVCE